MNLLVGVVVGPSVIFGVVDLAKKKIALAKLAISTFSSYIILLKQLTTFKYIVNLLVGKVVEDLGVDFAIII